MADGQLDVAGHNTRSLVVASGVASKLEGLQLDDPLLPQREEGHSVLGVDLQRDSQGPPFLVLPTHFVDRDEAMLEPLVKAALTDAAGEVGHQLVGLVLLALVVEVPHDPLRVVQHHRLDVGHLSSKEPHFFEQRRDHFWLRLGLPFFIRRFLFFCYLLLRHFLLKVIAGLHEGTGVQGAVERRTVVAEEHMERGDRGPMRLGCRAPPVLCDGGVHLDNNKKSKGNMK